MALHVGTRVIKPSPENIGVSRHRNMVEGLAVGVLANLRPIHATAEHTYFRGPHQSYSSMASSGVMQETGSPTG